eukprot:TRINITY_DN11401_c0_g1_i4.p1 TRINITY_DN11401_c0_g1~~TRINITY_DN11401_c0_g1_i4.p1  ORF type:complete len:219 (-),score=-24.57 TRINITY_DN11401_c0_g1_i4:94-750(-)
MTRVIQLPKHSFQQRYLFYIKFQRQTILHICTNRMVSTKQFYKFYYIYYFWKLVFSQQQIFTKRCKMFWNILFKTLQHTFKQPRFTQVLENQNSQFTDAQHPIWNAKNSVQKVTHTRVRKRSKYTPLLHLLQFYYFLFSQYFHKQGSFLMVHENMNFQNWDRKLNIKCVQYDLFIINILFFGLKRFCCYNSAPIETPKLTRTINSAVIVYRLKVMLSH